MQKDDEGLQKHTLNLFEGDYEKMKLLYSDTGAAAIIRRLVRRYIEQIEANPALINAKVEIEI